MLRIIPDIRSITKIFLQEWECFPMISIRDGTSEIGAQIRLDYLYMSTTCNDLPTDLHTMCYYGWISITSDITPCILYYYSHLYNMKRCICTSVNCVDTAYTRTIHSNRFMKKVLTNTYFTNDFFSACFLMSNTLVKSKLREYSKITTCWWYG